MRGARTVRVVRILIAALAAALLLAALPAAGQAATTGSISGTVTKAGGIPVAGAHVWAEGDEDEDVAITDAAGHYTLPTLSPGQYEIEFDAPSGSGLVWQLYQDTTSRAHETLVTVTAGGAVTGIDATLHNGGSVTGTVTDDAGPVANTDVILLDEDGAYIDDAVTSSSGTYTIGTDAPGTYRVYFEPTGDRAPQYFDDATTLAAAAPVTIGEGATTPGIDAHLHAGSHIAGTVTDDQGAPLAGAWVDVYSSDVVDPDEEDSDAYAKTDASGRYTVPGLSAGTYKVRFTPPDGSPDVGQWARDKATSDEADPITVAAQSTQSGVDAQLHAGGKIQGTVTDDHGAAQAGVDVEVFVPSDDDSGWYGEAETDTAGHYSVVGVPAGSYTVAFWPDEDGDLLPQTYDDTDWDHATPVVVGPAQTVTGIDAHLHAGASIAGTVTDRSGAPVRYVEVGLFSAGGTSDDDDDAVDWTETDASGHYTFHGVPAGSYAVRFEPEDDALTGQWYAGQATRATATPVVVQSGQATTGIDAHLTLDPSIPTGLTGSVHDDAGHVLAGAVVTAYTPTGTATPVATTTAGADGRYTLSVPPGSYRIGVTQAGQPTTWYPFPSTAANADVVPVSTHVQTLELVLPAPHVPLGTITGRILDYQHRPITGSIARVQTATGLNFAVPDATGTFRQTTPAGTYKVEAGITPNSSDNRRWWAGNAATVTTARSFVLGSGATVSVGDIVFPKSVYDPYAKPPPVAKPVSVKVASKVSKRGRVALTLRCPGGATRCTGKVTLTAKVGHRRVTLGKTTYAVKPRGHTTGHVQVGGAGRSLLAKHHGKLTVTITVQAKGLTKSTVSQATLRSASKR